MSESGSKPETNKPDIPGIRALEKNGRDDGGKAQDDTVGKGFSPDEQAKNFSERMKNVLSLHKNRRAMVGGTVFGGIITLVIAAILAIVPLKINSMVNNIQQRFYAGVSQASQKESETLLSSYLKRHVFPSLTGKGTCTSTAVSRNCVQPISGNNPVAKMYDGWRQGRIENQLANKYGLEFGRNGTGQIYMKAPGLPHDGVNLGTISQLEADGSDIFSHPQVNRGAARQAVRDALRNETRYNRVMMRIKAGRLLEDKYGIKRCVIACNARDKFSDKIAVKKKAAQAKFIERLIEPRSATLAVAVKCFVEPSCKPGNFADNSPESPESNGEPENGAQRDTDEALRLAERGFGEKTLDELAKLFDGAREGKTFTQYLVKELLVKIGVQEGAATAGADWIPIVGWINLGAQATSGVGHADEKVKYFRYTLYAAGAVGVWAMHQTVADETKSGHMDAAELGSFVNQLGPDASKDNGGAGAESTPIYNAVINNQVGTQTTSFMPSLFTGAFASSTKAGPYRCDDGKPVPTGTLRCKEEANQNDAVIENITKALEFSPIPGGAKIVLAMADFWNSTIGAIVKGIASLASGLVGLPCKAPGIKDGCAKAQSLMAAAIQPIFTWFVNAVFPSAIKTSMNGGRMFTFMVAGADVAANDFAHHGLGGKLLSPVAVKQQEQTQLAEDQAEFTSRPLFARIFNQDSPYSLVSRVALAMPSNFSAASTRAATLINPFTSLGNVFSSIFSTPHTFAASALQADPFDIKHYGFEDSDIPADPEDYWNKHCTDSSQLDAWNDSAKNNVDPQTGETINTTANPCLLIKGTAESAGALYGN